MKIAFDENVLMDVLTKKYPEYEKTSELLDLVAAGRAEGYVMLNTITAIYRIAKDKIGQRKAKNMVSEIAFLLKTLPIPDGEKYLFAYNGTSDLEDMLLICSSECASMDYIVSYRTENMKDSKIPVRTPDKICEMLQRQS